MKDTFIYLGTNKLHMEQNDERLDLKIVGSLLDYEGHIRELSRRVKLNHMAVKRTTDKMLKKNILDFRFIGKNKVFVLKKSLESRNKILEYEIYKQIKIIDKYPLLRSLFEKIISNKKITLCLLFGSYAKGLAHERSDIDIYFDSEDINVKKELESLNSKISVKMGKFDKDSVLIKEMIKNHVIIKGFEEYYGRIS